MSKKIKKEISYYDIPFPKIYDMDSTINLLLERKMSMARFGDGELELILGKAALFQEPSDELKLRLLEVLSSKNKNIMIGIPSELYYTKELTLKKKNVWEKWKPRYLPLLNKYLRKRQKYCPTYVSHFVAKLADKKAIEDYFEKIRTIWENKNVHLIYGRGIFHSFEYDIFDNVKSITHQTAPNINAFDSYDKILAEALKVDRDKLVIIILGPTATILAYDLGLKGYQALDMGHIAKAYDRHKRGFRDKKFWAPD